jgi:hypothetical protein
LKVIWADCEAPTWSCPSHKSIVVEDLTKVIDSEFVWKFKSFEFSRSPISNAVLFQPVEHFKQVIFLGVQSVVVWSWTYNIICFQRSPLLHWSNRTTTKSDPQLIIFRDLFPPFGNSGKFPHIRYLRQLWELIDFICLKKKDIHTER